MVKIEIADVKRMYEALVANKVLRELNDSHLIESINASGDLPRIGTAVKISSAIPDYVLYGGINLPFPLEYLNFSVLSDGNNYKGSIRLNLTNTSLPEQFKSGDLMKRAKERLLSNRDLTDFGNIFYVMLGNRPNFSISLSSLSWTIDFGESGTLQRGLGRLEDFETDMHNLEKLTTTAVNAFYEKDLDLTLSLSAYPKSERP